MPDANARSLSNSFQSIRLVSLASWSKAAEFAPRDKAGPYVLLQEGYDPGDISMTPDEFLLGRSGKWLRLGHFFRLPVPERRDEFVFATSAEAIQVLSSLPPKVVIAGEGDDRLAAGATPSEAQNDDLAAAIQSGRSGVAPAASE